MKTRLLFLLLITFVFGNAQINVSEGFESGTIPNGWGNNNFSINNTVACSGNYSCSFSTFGLGSGAEIASPTYTSTGASITVSADYRRSSSGSAGAIFYLEYYNFTTSSWVTITTTTSFSTTCQTLSATIPAGTIQAGANVAFKAYIYSTGSSFIFYVDNFVARENVPQAIAEYNFNNTYNNTVGTNPFASNSATSFSTDRHGIANGALNINNIGTIATISGLPYGSDSRTIAVWAKTNVINNTINYIFHYGNEANGNGLALRPTTLLYFANAGANLETANTFTNDTWGHYVCTYDGSTAKVYKNGVLFSSGAKSFNTTNASNTFKLGISEGGFNSYFNGAIDDLKIFNYVLNATEISNLFSNNSLSSSGFSQNNLQVSLYPNPVNDILTIETETEIKSITIYNLQGQKVKTSFSKQVNVSDLSSDIYMVRIEGANYVIETKKIVKL